MKKDNRKFEWDDHLTRYKNVRLTEEEKEKNYQKLVNSIRDMNTKDSRSYRPQTRFSVAVLLTTIFIILSGFLVMDVLLHDRSGPTSSHPFEIKNIESIEGIWDKFKLPTELPFEVEEAGISYVHEHKSSYIEDTDEIQGYTVEFYFISAEQYVLIRLEDGITIENITGRNEQKIVLSDDTEAVYFFNGASQMLFWDDGDINYSIQVGTEIEGKEKYTIEDLINIADSFQVYK
ncbi:hypothetical protein [Alkalihalobacterium chitinilyticum]|uniref:DUF4367 domain-containing protein n=1 Tax=Alkalihalobacterium chitinilyticum TaxID=2980103 RepID=A0ABT5VN02_9BACI|nr:hypothetical protein [Alkalihalobacterium chitinilyticum]MDE5415649.1 hypothetical protein [Alkalihalobacterium chitinilyticum]